MRDLLDGLPDFAGRLDLDDASLEWAALDYGDQVHHRPRAVLRPASEQDIAALLRHAAHTGLPVVPRGQGHSTAGQAQAPGGVVVDMTTFDQIHDIRPDRIIVDAGVRWSQVLHATLPHGLTPPVLTDYLELSIGGTLSVGGLGGMSHQHGAQTDNVIELDVITLDGTSVTCSPHRHREIFDAVRAGRGRNGVITRATLRLIPAPTTVRWHHLRYPDLNTFLADQHRLVREQRFDYLEGQVKLRDGHRVIELETVAHQGNARIDDLNYVSADTEDVPYWDFLNRLAPGEQLIREAGMWLAPHPWCNVLLPAAAANTFLTTAAEELHQQLHGEFGLVLAYPILTSKISTPKLRLPAGDVVFLIAALRHTLKDAHDKLAAMHAANARWVHDKHATGGTLYLDPL